MAAKKEADIRFSKFGTVSFTAITKVNDFVDFLEQGKVMGSRCKDCGLMFFPPRADCHKCLAGNMEWFEVTGKGRLVSYSSLAFAPIGFGDDLPYTIALVDYGQYKVFARLSPGLKPEDVSVGMEMKTVANRLPNGQLNYVFERV